MTIPFSAGSLYSTTGDLLKWERGLFGGKVLKPESLKKMTTPFKQDYAFGLEVATLDGYKEFMHGGAIEGFRSYLAYFPDTPGGPADRCGVGEPGRSRGRYFAATGEHGAQGAAVTRAT